MAFLTKKKKYNVSCSSEIKKSFPFTRACPATVADYKHKFRCAVCDKNFSLAAAGAEDVCRHSETKTPKDNARQRAS